MDQDWFAPEVPPAPETGPRKAPGTAPAAPGDAPGGALAPATKTADEKPLEEKPEDWFSKPSTLFACVPPAITTFYETCYFSLCLEGQYSRRHFV